MDSQYQAASIHTANEDKSNDNYEEKVIKSNNNDDESEAGRSLHSQNVPQAPQAPQTLVIAADSLEKMTVVKIRYGDEFDVYIGRKCQGYWHEDDTFGNPYPVSQNGLDESLRVFKEYFYYRLKTDAYLSDKSSD